MNFKNIMFNSAFGISTLAVIVFFYRNIWLTTLLLGIISLIALIKLKSKLILILFFIGAIVGVIAEVIAINYGVWAYSNPNFINVPIWLFFAWGNAAVFTYLVSLEIKEFGIKK